MVATNTQSGFATKAARPGIAQTNRSEISRQEAEYDAKLVRRFNAGDEEAFAEIVARYRSKMFSIALCHLRNHADAEEIAQDTFIRAHRGLARFRGDSSLATWLHRIAFNLSRNRYKYYFCRRRHAMLSLDCAFSEDNQATFSDLIASDSPSPSREATSGEFTELVNGWARASARSSSFAMGRTTPMERSPGRSGSASERSRAASGAPARSSANSFPRRTRSCRPTRPLTIGSTASAPADASRSPAPEGACPGVYWAAGRRPGRPGQTIVTWTLLSMMPCAIA